MTIKKWYMRVICVKSGVQDGVQDGFKDGFKDGAGTYFDMQNLFKI